MRKLWVIIKREYFTRVRKKSFLLTTILVPLLVIGFYIAMGFLATSSAGASKKTIAVVDESGMFTNQFRDGNNNIYYKYPKGSFEEVKGKALDEGYTGILYVPEFDIYKVNDNIQYFSDENLGLSGKETVKSAIRERIQELRREDKGLDKETLDLVSKISDFEWNPNPLFEEEKDQTAEEVLSGIGYVMGFMLYFILIFFGMMVMRGVKEEKTNRIVEVIVSSVKPFQLMMGKIIGISLVGVTQFVIWGAIIYFGNLLFLPKMLANMNLDPEVVNGTANATQMADAPDMAKLLISLKNYPHYGRLALSFIFYFLGGYMIYASLFSAVGSAIEDDSEAQKLVFPVMMPIIMAVVILSTLFNDPHNMVAKWASIFPLTSPIVMPARIPFNPEPWEIVASVVCLLLGVVFFVWLSGKIFRIGILMYGKKVSFKELIKWLRY